MTAQPMDELPILVRWEKFLAWLLPTLEKLPKKIRFTLTNRLENLALDLFEGLIEARYRRRKRDLLQACNLKLEKIRLLLRLSHTLQYLPHKAYEHAMRELHETGKMLGGWMRSREAE